MEELTGWQRYVIYLLIIGILFLAVMLLVFTNLKDAFWPGIAPVVTG